MPDHIPVFLSPCISALNIKPNGIYLDGTFGRGGHSSEILKYLDQNGQLIICDKDPEAILYAQNLFQNDPRVLIIHDSFANVFKYLENNQNKKIKLDGILLDLGVSSPQIDQAERGFSFQKNGPLDMRMDFNSGQSAAEWINTASESELFQIFKLYGEEPFAKLIAKHIIQFREKKRFETTLDLANLIQNIIPKKVQIKSKKHPATRVFQAIRIFINKELKDLEDFLNHIPNYLSHNGRLAIISFHSLEDRRVKQQFKLWTEGPKINQPIDLMVLNPLDSNHKPLFKWVSKRHLPTKQDCEDNIRSRSAVLRVVEFLGD